VAQFIPSFIPSNGLIFSPRMRTYSATSAASVRFRTSSTARGSTTDASSSLPSSFDGAESRLSASIGDGGATDPLVDHARDCVDNFGKCSVEDMENTRLSLHAERLKNLLTGLTDASWPQDELDRRALEHDLTLQLDLLKDHIGADEMDMVDLEIADARVHHMSADEMVNDLTSLDAALRSPQKEDAPIDASEVRMRGGGSGDGYTMMTKKKGHQEIAPRMQFAVRPVGDAVPVPVPLSDAVAPDDHAHWDPWMEDFAVQGWRAVDSGIAETVAILVTVAMIVLLPQALGHAQI